MLSKGFISPHPAAATSMGLLEFAPAKLLVQIQVARCNARMLGRGGIRIQPKCQRMVSPPFQAQSAHRPTCGLPSLTPKHPPSALPKPPCWRPTDSANFLVQVRIQGGEASTRLCDSLLDFHSGLNVLYATFATPINQLKLARGLCSFNRKSGLCSEEIRTQSDPTF